MKSFTLFVALTLAAVANGSAVVTFSYFPKCVTPTETYHGSCNFCSSPPGNVEWTSIGIFNISLDYRVSIHRDAGCTQGSQVGQVYGPSCWTRGEPYAYRSAWVACPEDLLANNGTVIDGGAATVDSD